jgi:hypothetical protein
MRQIVDRIGRFMDPSLIIAGFVRYGEMVFQPSRYWDL